MFLNVVTIAVCIALSIAAFVPQTSSERQGTKNEAVHVTEEPAGSACFGDGGARFNSFCTKLADWEANKLIA